MIPLEMYSIKLSTKQKQLLLILFFFLNASLDFAIVLSIISVSCAHTCSSVTIEDSKLRIN